MINFDFTTDRVFNLAANPANLSVTTAALGLPFAAFSIPAATVALFEKGR